MSDRLLVAARAFKRAERTYERARDELAAAIVEAADQGEKQVRIVEITDYTREHIRRLVKDAHEARAAAQS